MSADTVSICALSSSLRERAAALPADMREAVYLQLKMADASRERLTWSNDRLADWARESVTREVTVWETGAQRLIDLHYAKGRSETGAGKRPSSLALVDTASYVKEGDR